MSKILPALLLFIAVLINIHIAAFCLYVVGPFDWHYLGYLMKATAILVLVKSITGQGWITLDKAEDMALERLSFGLLGLFFIFIFYVLSLL
jgi:hypothetical protein